MILPHRQRCIRFDTFLCHFLCSLDTFVLWEHHRICFRVSDCVTTTGDDCKILSFVLRVLILCFFLPTPVIISSVGHHRYYWHHLHLRAVSSIACIRFISDTLFSQRLRNAPISWFSIQYVCAMIFFCFVTSTRKKWLIFIFLIEWCFYCFLCTFALFDDQYSSRMLVYQLIAFLQYYLVHIVQLFIPLWVHFTSAVYLFK